MIWGCREPAVEFWFVLTVSNISTSWFRDEGLSKDLYNFRRRIGLGRLVSLNLLPAPASTAKLFGLESLCVVTSTVLGVSIIISSTSITVHIPQLGIAFTGLLRRQVLFGRNAFVEITERKLTKFVISPGSEIATEFSELFFVTIAKL